MHRHWQRKLNPEALKNPRNKLQQQQIQHVYGTTEFDEELLLKKYNMHIANAKNYFQQKNHNLLVMDVEAGDGWEKLCPFLGKEVLTSPFPK